MVKFGDVILDTKGKVDRTNNPYDYYIAGDHMDTEDLELHRKGCFATDDVGPAFVRTFKPGQVLYGSRRTYLKKVAVADFEGVTANTTFVFETKDSSVLSQELLPFIMWSDKFTDFSILKSRGSTNPYVLFSDLAEYEFNLPDLAKQGELAELLWSMEYTKRAYRKMIAQTDELVKSQFVEMFGDPETNPRGWHRCCLKDVMSAQASNGFFAKPTDYKNDGNAGIICVGDVVNRKYSNMEGLRRADADEKQFAKYRVKYGDMLFCRSSLVKEGIAKASIIPQNHPDDLLFECHVIRIPLDLHKVIPEFMQAFSTTDYFRGQMMDKSKTATMTTIGQKDVITGAIYVPPMELQRQFAFFSQQTDKSKVELQKALDELTAMQKKIIERNLT